MEIWKYPRLYVDCALNEGAAFDLSQPQTHYLKNVLRLGEGTVFRVFNGRDGEFKAEITVLDKKSGAARAIELIDAQPSKSYETRLYFAPIKKQRMDMMIEKAVELGATHLNPVLTAHTEVRKINEERMRAQIIEAAEQCERLDIPELAPLLPLNSVLSAHDKDLQLYWCNERGDAPSIATVSAERAAFLIGPEGGFSAEEADMLLQNPKITPISLGKRVYRSETASIICLTHAMLRRGNI